MRLYWLAPRLSDLLGLPLHGSPITRGHVSPHRLAHVGCRGGRQPPARKAAGASCQCAVTPGPTLAFGSSLSRRLLNVEIPLPLHCTALHHALPDVIMMAGLGAAKLTADLPECAVAKARGRTDKHIAYCGVEKGSHGAWQRWTNLKSTWLQLSPGRSPLVLLWAGLCTPRGPREASLTGRCRHLDQ